jgi:hypothetical protein
MNEPGYDDKVLVDLRFYLIFVLLFFRVDKLLAGRRGDKILFKGIN